jgi:hypothetical protein
VLIWFTVAWPAGQAPPQRAAVALGTCQSQSPPPATGADCTRQRSASLTGSWSPALSVLAADCIDNSPTTQPRTYSLYLSSNTQFRGTLAPVSIRWALAGSESVYMTAAPARAASGQPYEETDFLMPPDASSAILSYEGVLG